MREPYQPPTTSPTGLPHDHAHHSRTHQRHSRVGGNPPPASKPTKRRPSSRLLQNRQNPTESDKILRKLVCAHARARQRRSVPFSLHGLDSTYRFGVAVP